MKGFFIAIAAIFLLACAEKNDTKPQKTERIKVGVFNRNGDNPWCIVDAVEACRIDPDVDVEVISAAQIMSGAANDFDVFLFPGGGGRSETSSLGHVGMEKVKKMVTQQGKGVIGICAGAYILTDTPNYPSFELSGYKAIDIEHDHRGNALSAFTLTEAGKKMFPEISNIDTLFCQYYEGPVLVEAPKRYDHSSLATMQTDVHVIEGTPANMTNNRPFVTTAQNGKGRSVSFVGHPECTPGMRWMVARMVRWAAKRPIIEYSSAVVRPNLFKSEIIFDKPVKAKMFAARQNLYSTPEQIVVAIEELKTMAAWSAKKWINGLVRHSDKNVRAKAAEALAWMERTDAIQDIKAAVDCETDLETKKSLSASLKTLTNMVGAAKQ